MSPLSVFVTFFSIVVLGVGLEILITHLFKKSVPKPTLDSQRMRRFLFLLTFPLLAVAWTVYQTGITVLLVFVIFSFAGMFIEFLIGFSYHRVVGERLWTYHHVSLCGYTSIFSIPLWGLAGVMFWLLAQVV